MTLGVEYMQRYTEIKVSEQTLEDLIRQHVDKLESGLRYVHRQKALTAGRLDMLLADSGNSLVLAELKVVEDDGMLFQALGYYDQVSSNLEAFAARLYGDDSIDPTQPVRLFLIAPSFSQSLIARCKWIDIPLSLYTYKCIKLDGSEETIPVFSEQTIPPRTEPLVAPTDPLDYITDAEVRVIAESLLNELRLWDADKVVVEPKKGFMSLKVSGRVFAYLSPRRKHFVIETQNQDGTWTGYPIHTGGELDAAKELVRKYFDRFHR